MRQDLATVWLSLDDTGSVAASNHCQDFWPRAAVKAEGPTCRRCGDACSSAASSPTPMI
jgi:hypothetical protein